MENRRAPRCEIGDIRISHSAATFWVNHGPSNRCPGPLCSFWLVESLSRVNTTLQYKSIKKFSDTYSQIKYRFKLGKKILKILAPPVFWTTKNITIALGRSVSSSLPKMLQVIIPWLWFIHHLPKSLNLPCEGHVVTGWNEETWSLGMDLE